MNLGVDKMGEVERKVLGALLRLCDDALIVKINYKIIADEIGYKQPGGTITYALRLLEKNDYITRLPNKRVKILI